MNIVLDTNVLVSALLNPHGSPARLLDLILLGKLVPLYDDRILLEYRQVLSRERFGFEMPQVEALLQFIEEEGIKIIAPPLPSHGSDPDDLMFLEVALSGRAGALITGNVKHFPSNMRRGVHVLNPAAFLAKHA